jgi:hypothetical protein
VLGGAESKDLGGAYLTHAVRSFSTTEPHRAGAYICIGSHTGPLHIGATGIHPEFKDLAQTWGWKMITVHEKMYP